MARFDPSKEPGEPQETTVDETYDLISADKVEGTTVYNAEGDNLGSVHDIMIDKRSGRVAFVVVSFGGFLGIGEKYHPLPWNVLTYDEDKKGYNVDMQEDFLRKAPMYTMDQLDEFQARNYGRDVFDYYIFDDLSPGKFTEYGADVNYHYQLTDHLDASVGALLRRRDFTGSSREDDYIAPQVSLTLQRALPCDCDVQLQYRYRENDSNELLSDYHADQVSLQLTTRF